MRIPIIPAVCSLALAPAASAQTAGECFRIKPILPQLVGFTTERFDGSGGVLAYTQACQAEFPGSRMCTVDEVLDTVTVPSGLAGSAWVRPRSAPNSAQDCTGWRVGQRVSGVSGTFVTPSGGIGLAPCDALSPIACCAPVP